MVYKYNRRATIATICTVCIALISIVYTGRTILMRQQTPDDTRQLSALPVYTAQSLREYDGSGKHQQILLAFEGNVYDVTSGGEFYSPGAPYHFLAGTDATAMLRIAGGAIIKRKYHVIGKLKQ